jgi:hypothetical protein
MRGVCQSDAIESVSFKHAEGNEGEKIAVERRNGEFVGSKLLKKQGTASVGEPQNPGIGEVKKGAKSMIRQETATNDSALTSRRPLLLQSYFTGSRSVAAST